jgi:DUF917 family protein
MATQTLSKTDLRDILNGAVILGNGGGGPMSSGQALLKQVLSSPNPVRTVDPYEDVADQDTMAGVFFHSTVDQAPAARMDVDSAVHAFNALNEIERNASGRDFAYVLPLEVGAATLLFLAVAARLNLPVIDGDSAGHAINSLIWSSFAIPEYKLPLAPIALSNGRQSISLASPDLNTASNSMWAAIGGPPLNGDAGMAFWAMDGKGMKPAIVPHTLTAARLLGKALRDALRAHRDPVQAVVDHLKGYLLFRGHIAGFTPQPNDIATGSLVVQSKDSTRTARVYNTRENMILYTSDQPEPAVMGPDLICYLTADGKPFTNEDLAAMPNYGVGTEMALIGVEAGDKCRNPFIVNAYLQALQNMAYAGPYVPIEQLWARRTVQGSQNGQ